MGALGESINHLAAGIILLMAGQGMRRGDFTVGDFALFIWYIGEGLELPRRVGRLLAQRRKTAVSIERLHQLGHAAAVESMLRHQPVYLRRDPAPAPYPMKPRNTAWSGSRYPV